MFSPELREYKKWMVYGLLVQVIAACFSIGFHHPDEHYQVMEFCSYKLGHASATDLPWEFAVQSRSAVLPFIAWCIGSALSAFGAFHPFVVAFLLRLLTGLLTWIVTCRVVRMLLPEFESERGRKLFVLFSFLLWYIPYLGVRFSAENISGLLFFLAITMFYRSKTQPDPPGVNLFYAGSLLGFALFVRFQMGLAFIGLLAWLLFAAKWGPRNWLVLMCGGLAAAAVAICLDRWLYNVWTITPFNYFSSQILQHKAANWGVTPWWDYFWMFFQMAIPPLSVVLLLAFFAGIFRKPMHLFSWIMISFIIGHFFIGHKEMRFLFPVSLAFIFVMCGGADQFAEKILRKRTGLIVYKVLVFINIAVLTVKALTPAQEAVSYYRFVYDFCTKQKTLLLAQGSSPYNTVGAEMKFYRHDNLDVQVFTETGGVDSIIGQNKDREVIYLSDRIIKDEHLAGHSLQRIYCLFPDWLLKFNMFGWQDRSNIWTVYRVMGKNG